MARNILTSTTNANLGNLHYYHLPKALLKLTIQTVSGRIKITTCDRELIADPDARYFLNYKPNAFTNDQITIVYGANGFLSKVHTTIVDETGNFIKEAVNVAAAVIEGSLGIPGVPKTRNVQNTDTILFTGTIDPFREEHINMVNEAINVNTPKDEEKLVFKVQNLKQSNETPRVTSTESRFGIYCRPMGTFEVSLSSGSDRVANVIALPDPDELNFIEIPSPSFVSSTFNVDFNETGYPTTITINKPSSALAIIKVPLEILGALIALPAKIFKLRIDLDNQRNTAINSEMVLMQNRQKLDAENEKLAEAARLVAAAASAQQQEAQKEQATRAASTESSVSEQEFRNLQAELKKSNRAVNALEKANEKLVEKLNEAQKSDGDTD